VNANALSRPSTAPFYFVDASFRISNIRNSFTRRLSFRQIFHFNGLDMETLGQCHSIQVLPRIPHIPWWFTCMSLFRPR